MLRSLWSYRGFREALGTVIWVVATTTFFLLSRADTHWRHAVSAFLGGTPTQLFLGLLLPFIAVCDVLGLTFDSTINPSLGVAFALGDVLNGWDFVSVLLPAQVVGHMVGVQILRRLVPASMLERKLLSPPSPIQTLSPLHAAAVEAALTFGLSLGLLALPKLVHRRSLRLGLVCLLVGALLSVGMPFTGACMNPAMAVTLAAHESDFRDQWVYVVGPVAGAMGAGAVFRLRGGKKAKR